MRQRMLRKSILVPVAPSPFAAGWWSANVSLPRWDDGPDAAYRHQRPKRASTSTTIRRQVSIPGLPRHADTHTKQILRHLYRSVSPFTWVRVLDHWSLPPKISSLPRWSLAISSTSAVSSSMMTRPFSLTNTMPRLQLRPLNRRLAFTTIFALGVFAFIAFRVWRLDEASSRIFLASPQTEHLPPPPPPPPPPKIPKKLWYKLGPSGLNPDTTQWTNSCIHSNPDYNATFLTDADADAWVATAFGATHPDLVASYQDLRVPILKADLLRYLLLFVEGGIWSDLDVSCDPAHPIREWIPSAYRDTANMVVGWEFDVGWGDNIVRQFSTWTIMASPALPHMWTVIEDILQGLRDKTAEHKLNNVSELTFHMVGDVVDFTGPRRFTNSVFASLDRSPVMNGTKVDHKSLEELMEPKLVGDVLILPGYSFSLSANRYDEKDMNRVGLVLVTHHYAGSWKNDKGGELT